MSDPLIQVKQPAVAAAPPSPARTSQAPSTRLWAPGIANAVVALAMLLSLGLLAWVPLGPAATAPALASAFVTVVVSSTLFAALSRSVLPCTGPSSATAVVFGSLVLQVLKSQPADLPLALAATTGAAVAGMGLVQMLMGLLRLGRLAGYVPQPVLSGFMNGVALLVVLAQLPPLLAVDRAVLGQGLAAAWAAAQPGALALGSGTAAAVWLVARRRPRWPATMLGLVLGALAYHAVHALWPGAGLGPTLGPVAAALPVSPVAAWWTLGGVAGLEPRVATTALVLALTGSLEAVLSLRAVDQQFAARSSPDRGLVALGIANLAGGLFGALPLTVSRNGAAAIGNAGGRGRAPALAGVLLSGLLLLAAETVIAQVPRAVVAGVMLTVGVALFDTWSRELLRRTQRGAATREHAVTLATVLGVAVVTALAGTAAGLALGFVVASAAFTMGVRGSVVRSRASGELRPSRRVWPAADETLLAPLRRQIMVIELQGALFFGTAQRVADECEQLAGSCRYLVLDLRRLGTIDDSGAAMLQRLRDRLAPRGTELMLASVDTARPLGRQLAAYLADGDGGRWFPDADRAMEAAEREMLRAAPPSAVEPQPPLSASGLLRDLSPADAARVDALMPPRALAAGELLFREGDVADALYVVSRGAVSVASADGRHRYASFGPGTVFGEMAVLDGEGRTADARADGAAEVRCLARATLEQLQSEHPALAARLYRNVARQTSLRLRIASEAWQAAAD